MKTSSFFGTLLLAAAISLSFSSCSSDDDTTTVEEEPSFMEGKMPSNLHVGMIYPISHDKVNDKCTFGIYLGENPSQELIEALEQERVHVVIYDKYGNEVSNDYNGSSYNFNSRGKFRHDNTIALPCALCEIITKFTIEFRATLYEFLPELADLSDVKLHLCPLPSCEGQVQGVTITQSWSSPHHYYY